MGNLLFSFVFCRILSLNLCVFCWIGLAYFLVACLTDSNSIILFLATLQGMLSKEKACTSLALVMMNGLVINRILAKPLGELSC